MRDVNRIGFTQLLGGDNARSGPYRVNIVFVHGLRGHPRYTWENDRAGGGETDVSTSSKRKTFKSFLRAKPSTPTTDTNTYEGSSALRRLFWPDEYLTHDIPEARVWTYGYNADAIGGLFQANNKNSVSQHGRDLAVRIEREIENEDPILFVAHSLGGIIVKDAIHRSDVCRSRTKLVVFLGTPHRGSSYAGWGEIAANLARLALHDSNKKIIETMEVNSEVLDNIHEEFKTIVPEYSIKVHSFQEARGILGIKGLDNKVVDDFSSKLDLPRGLETVESIDANHMQMARCSDTSDPQYRAVVGVLKQFMRSGKSSGALTSSTLKRDRLRTNVNSRLVALETSQEIMGAQCDRMSIILTELRNTTLSTVHLQESYTIGSEYVLDIEVFKSTSTKRWLAGSLYELGLPGVHDKLLRSLTSSHIEAEIAVPDKECSDLIRGKGRGLIILLNGRRGQDLSLTVEVIAKIMRRPLHRIRCTDLSHLRAADFEKVLKTQLSTSFQERAIVLMDEADMLLATRTMNELSRNAMVSITLRMMEYFQGILFLTATRVCTVDEAYRSRIHLSLHYPKMDRPSAIQVWKSELQCLRVEGGLTFNERDVMAFAKRSFTRTPDWNARQIHDIVRSAKELATHEHVKSMRTRKNRVPWSQPDQPVMTTNHLKRAAKACEYLKEEDDVEESDMEDSHIEEVEMSVETLALT